MPTDGEIKAYADKLPAIYRAVLAAFPAAAPRRRAGDELSIGTIVDIVTAHSPEYRDEDVTKALAKLTQRGFLIPPLDISLKPTEVGERLISAVTGHVPAPVTIPELPEPTWA